MLFPYQSSWSLQALQSLYEMSDIEVGFKSFAPNYVWIWVHLQSGCRLP